MGNEKRVPNVLVIDDDPLLCEMLRVTFELEGIEMAEAEHVIAAEQRLAAKLPDAIVLDIGLPGVDGLFYCERLRESPRTRNIPIVVISGSREAGMLALSAGAQSFLQKPFDPFELLGRIETLFGRTPLEETLGETADGEAGPDESGDLRRLLAISRRQHELVELSYRQTLEALASALEARDFGTSAHSQRVTAYATRLTVEFAPSLIDDTSLEWGFLLHDVGKMAIPDRILLKPGALSSDERLEMQQHAVIGESLLAHVPLLHGEGLRVVRSHHERWDGAGYPDRLAGEAIPLGARLFAVADALDAMTSDRPYRAALDWDQAAHRLAIDAGTHFDPDVVDAFVACEVDLQAVCNSSVAAAAAA
jgi:response regulator RpfG family c-di-GMP phosphodiesterase